MNAGNRKSPVQSRFAEMLTLTLNPNFGESGFGESGRHQPLTPISSNRFSANREDTKSPGENAYINIPGAIILGSLVWPFRVKVMWRHRSHDHSIAHIPFPISGPLERTKPISLTVSKIFSLKCNATVDVTLIRPLNKGQGHSFWYQIDSSCTTSYRLSILTLALGRTV